MADRYLFVDARSSSSSEETKRLRRHVMLGKNAGRTLHRPSRRLIPRAPRQGRIAGRIEPPALATRSFGQSHDTSTGQCMVLGPLPAVGHAYSALQRPVQPSTEARKVIADCE